MCLMNLNSPSLGTWPSAQGSLVLLSACRANPRLGLHASWGAEESGRVVSWLGVCRGLGCTLLTLDFKVKWPGVSGRK